MPRALLCALTFVVGLGARAADPDPRTLAVPAADRERAVALVAALASPSFTDRDQATQHLRAMGRLALPTLAAAAAHPDPEVRMRAGLLAPAARLDDFDARLACFLADTDAKFPHELPGWTAFRAAAGDGPERRQFFAALLGDKVNRDLMAATAGDPADLHHKLDVRQRDLYLRVNPPGDERPHTLTAQDLAALLLAETAAGDRPAPRVGAVITPYSLLGRSSSRVPALDGPDGEVIRKLTGAWMTSRRGAMALYQAALVAQYRDLPEGMAVAAKLIAADGATPLQRVTAAATVAKVGAPADWKVIAPLFADETPVRPQFGGAAVDSQVRDVALAVAAKLVGREVEDFGMTGRVSWTTSRVYWSVTFPSAEARAKGFAKWAELEPTLPKPEKGSP